MIPLTKLDGQVYYLNEALVKKIEGTPDTVITLLTGDVFRVTEEVLTVVELIRDYQRSLHSKI